MPPISLLIKPASSSCNMRCEYCFYSDVANRRAISNYGMMSLDTLETLIRKALELAEGEASFGFQGGEPTLAGLDFYRQVIALEKEHNRKGLRIHNAIQTNGLNIDDEWAAFFHDNHFLVGLSLDGTREVHDKYRRDSAGNGTFDRVLEAAARMNRFHVEYNILSTVNRDVARNVDKIYYFFKKQGFRYLQFIPCLDELQSGGLREYSLTPEQYGAFLKRLFDLWYVDLNSSRPVSIRYFDNLVGMAAGYPPESCGMSGVCGCYYMVEADGSVYPCDFYVTDEWLMGSVLTDDLARMQQSDVALRFHQLSVPVASACRECPHYRLCRGGCRRNREPLVPGEDNLNRLCPAFREFFDYAAGDLRKAAEKFLSASRRR